MRFLADENFPLESVRRLRSPEYDILAVAEIMHGAKDSVCGTSRASNWKDAIR